MKRPSRNPCAAVQNSASVHSVCTAVEIKPTRSNAQQQQPPVNIAYGLYVSTRPMAVFHKSEYMYINLVLNRLKYVRRTYDRCYGG